MAWRRGRTLSQSHSRPSWVLPHHHHHTPCGSWFDCHCYHIPNRNRFREEGWVLLKDSVQPMGSCTEQLTPQRTGSSRQQRQEARTRHNSQGHTPVTHFLQPAILLECHCIPILHSCFESITPFMESEPSRSSLRHTKRHALSTQSNWQSRWNLTTFQSPFVDLYKNSHRIDGMVCV